YTFCPSKLGMKFKSFGDKYFSMIFIFQMPHNVLGLCDGGAIEVQIFNFVQKFNRRTTVELCSFAPLLQNPC
ncbi:hypothetical protein, partial [Kaistella treverensis]|uniref:hypothetical protein n=1 Tax=Kaistella treverensis TaxID=631455 RepID=UPI001C8774C4